MTFDRFSEYVKLMLATVFCGQLFIELVLGLMFNRPDLAAHPFPVALPVGIVAAVYGWWLVYKTKPTVYVNCPTCHSRVDRERLDTAPREP